MEDRKKLLFLAFPFPPNRAIGAVRCANMAKHLSLLGWRVTVVTIDPRLMTNHEPASSDKAETWCRQYGIERVFTGHEYRMLYGRFLIGRWWERPDLVRRIARRIAREIMLDPGIGWVRPVIQSCAIYKPGDYDIILASGSPFPAFEAGRRLSHRLGVVMVLDYRDLWSKEPHSYRRTPMRVLNAERNLLKHAAGVFVVSSGMAKCMKVMYSHANKLSVITNGYDPDEFRDIVPTRFAHPTVVYAGSFYPPMRIIDPVLDAICRSNKYALKEGKGIRLLYLGSQQSHVMKAASRIGAMQWVDIGGCVPRHEVYAALKGSLAAAVITSVESNVTPGVESILTGKLFEAMGAGAQVLMVAPSGTEAERVVEQTKAGKSFAGSEIDAMAEWLRRVACGYAVRPKADVSAYAWPEIAKKADLALRGVMKK